MSTRSIGALGAAILAAGAFGATALGASAPPPPKALNGHAITQLAAGLKTPTSFAVGGGSVFEGDGGNSTKGAPNGGVFVLKNGKGVRIAHSPLFVGGLAWHAKTLYVSGGVIVGKTPTWEISAWSGWNGTAFATHKVLYTAPKGLDGLNGIAVGPGGQLYVGVDVGLEDQNDHGPASKTPYLYDILSVSPASGKATVFASGIRQPWQLAFPAGSSSPYVSDLGQDKGAKNPPDFVLRVHRGDNYGFPGCNQTSAKACQGFAKPFKQFTPHTDIMGMAIVGKTLYMTSFQGVGGKGKGGEVLSMPLSGGTAKPVVTGFVAPTVGLAQGDGYLYIGELTGQIFRLKV